MLRVVSQRIVLGRPQALSISQGEDRVFRLVFIDPATITSDTPAGTPVDLSAGGDFTQTVRDRNGLLIVARPGALTTDGSDGSLDFEWGSADSADQAPQSYLTGVRWRDPSGNETQLHVASAFDVLYSVGRDTDTRTPAPIVVPGSTSQPFAGNAGTIVVPLFTLPRGRAATIAVRVAAWRPTTLEGAGWSFVGAVKNHGSDATGDLLDWISGGGSDDSPDIVGLVRRDNLAWDVEFDLDNATGEVRALITVDAGPGDTFGTIDTEVTVTPAL